MVLFEFFSNRKLYKSIKYGIIMEMINVSKEEYERMKRQIEKLKQLERIDFGLVRQFKDSLEDVKFGRIRRVA